jgi:hypothetical protein
MRRSFWLGCALLFPASLAGADIRPYVTLHDDGTFQALASPYVSVNSQAFMKLYDATGAPRPNVISVWSDFGLGGESQATYFFPQANAIRGIGFDNAYGGSGLFESAYLPLNAILLHNNVLALAQRIATNRATSSTADFAQYLFLLEFSHQWLAAVQVPGSEPGDLGTYPHWSFWYNSGDSPPGGNAWSDNGDGTFSTVPVDPGQVKYSSLDLYLMGLVDAGAVGSFDVLENAASPATPTDPLFGGRYSAQSLTDFDATPLTVTATSKTYTIGDIISANGERVPFYSPNSYTLGIVLMVSQDAGAAQIAADQAVFDPISVTLAPAFARATGGIASLTVITDGGEMDQDAGPEVDAGPDAGLSTAPDGGLDAGPTEGEDAGVGSGGKGGCETGFGAGGPALGLALVFWIASRRRSARVSSSPSNHHPSTGRLS